MAENDKDDDNEDDDVNQFEQIRDVEEGNLVSLGEIAVNEVG